MKEDIEVTNGPKYRVIVSPTEAHGFMIEAGTDQLAAIRIALDMSKLYGWNGSA
ncbi:hypothetical protein SAMN04487926_13836 [Paraburkholderia steynii]|uniref:Uncharacterized protein n=1 Tax=Paraburkholderia steynii TaxID=1245441 RepID=A0A7Z7FMC4_9BURK|nr:hypothetical protein [Paraburkholderia steynii]SDJ22780.1 hypothetical protein SAMN04487926_13836 [Paraburkholderia steynii]